jgi:amino acid adenylation domain-containing protein
MSVAAGTGRFFRASRERLELLRERRREEGLETQEAPALPRRQDRSAYPLSFSQERLWFLDRLDPENPAYNIPTSLRLRGRLDVAALARALREVVRRHEVLRATFHDDHGRPFQSVVSAAQVFLPVIDLRALPPGAREEEARRVSAHEAKRLFRLETGPLLRARLLRLGEEDYALGLEVHHIVADGWSLGVFVRELTALYAGGEVPELPIQYADYAAWQRERLTGEALAEQVAWWRERLAGSPPSLDLPTDRPRPAVQTFHGGRAAAELPAMLIDRLRSLAGSAGASLFMVLLAACQLLLARWSGQEDVPVGSPIAGRTRREVEGLIGLFLNHLVLRTDLSGDPTFRELLGRVRETAVGAYAHQDLPFEKLLAELETQRDLSRTPLFQVFFNLLSFPVPAARLPGLTIEGLEAASEPQSKFDMTFYLVEQAGGVRIDLVYNADLFDAARMDEALAQYRLLLEQAAADPDARIGSFSLLTEGARPILPDPTEALDASWPGSIADAVARHARETPDRIAVVWEGGGLSYSRLDEEVERVASDLRAAGVAAGDVVAIQGHRSAPLVPAIVGVMRAGAAFLILDPAYPEARNEAILAAARPAGVLAPHPPTPSPIPSHPPGEGEESSTASEEGVCRAAAPLSRREGGDGRGGRGEGLAYLAFTSGSTGTPKGVLGLHRSLTHFYPWMSRAFELGPEDRFSFLAGLAHDPLHRDVFTPLWLGAAVAIPDPERMAEPGWLAGWTARMGVTVSLLAPALCRLLTEPPAGPMPSLRRAFFVGDVLLRRDVERLRALAPEVSCINLYGSTETQRAVGYHRITNDADNEAREVYPLGRGMPDVQLLVLTRAGRLAGIGEVGEVSVRSPHLAGGYLDDPVLTAERFVANPFTGRAGDRIYRTGDLGRYRPGGEVEPLGRADLQVQIRGFRVELGEVEAALARHPAIREAVAVARGESGDRRLVGYAVPIAAPPDPCELRDFLRTRLPEPMIPAAFVFLDALPLTPNRKVDRKALPEPAREETGEAAAPQTPVEELLAAIWSEVLGIERIGPQDDFFALGGHSLRVTQVLARVRETFGVELPVRGLFETPTLAGLAAQIEAVLRVDGPAAALPLIPVPRGGDLPLSFAQERLWFLARLFPRSAAYNMPAALRLSGDLDPAVLAEILGTIVRRHEVLRTAFPEIDGEPRQRIHPVQPFSLPVVDLSGLSAASREAEAARLAREEAARPFDLVDFARGPLLRAALLRRDEREWTALLNLHHIVSDGWSVGVLVREIASLYAGAALPALPVQYADFTVWQRARLQGETLAAQIAYWRAALAGAPPVLALPLDRPRAGGSHRAGVRTAAFPPSLSAALRELGRRRGATLFMVLLAGFQALLHRITGEDDVVVGSPIANRTHPALEGLIGFFVNTLALRSRLGAGDPSFAELLGGPGGARATALAAYAHQDLPFEKLVEELRIERSLHHAPLFQVLLVLQNAPTAELSLPGLTLAPMPSPPSAAKLDLSLSWFETGDGLHAALDYDAGLFDAATAARLLEQLSVLFQGIAAHPESRLSDLPLLGEAQRHQIAVEWNDTAVARPAGRTLHGLFLEQAERTPGAVALVSEGERITYRQLADRVEQKAARLRDLGVGPDIRVAVALPRSPELVATLLAILHAGGAYVPLDPDDPPERREWIAADCGAALVVTEADIAASGPHPRPLSHLPPTPPPGEGRQEEADGDPQDALLFSPLPGIGRGELGEGPGVRASLAYILYTSGTTGRPKGAMVPHSAAVNHILWAQETYALGPGDAGLLKTPTGFDVSVRELFWPLAVGARLVIARPGGERDPGYLLDLIEREGVTVANFVPSLLAAVLDRGTVPPLKRIISGGEALSVELAEQCFQRLPGTLLHNHYGPTETAVTATSWRCRPGERPLPIGRPIANLWIDLLDVWGHPVPIGVTGEVQVGGAGVGRGYLGRPELTAERFVPDPREPGARRYRTGDLARRRPDGALEFLGRRDHQIKVRGLRIEPEEVEAALAALSDVREAAVVAKDGALIAYVVTAAPDLDVLRTALAARLPAFLVPSAFVPVDALPRTVSGKVDRRALAKREIGRRTDAGVPPRDDLERELAQIWEDLLNVRPIGVRDDFFHLGGHSLLAVRLAARIESRFGRPLPLATLFEQRTVEALAGRLRTERVERATEPVEGSTHPMDHGIERVGRSPEWGERSPHSPARSSEPVERSTGPVGRPTRSGAPATESALVRIQPGGSRPPLFLIHPGGGGVLCYADLSRALGPDQPLYGLQAPGLDGERPPLDRIEDMASLYLEAIRAVRPQGPWHLGGWSFGGLVAYEMACQLAEQGKPAGLVAILDAAPRDSAAPQTDEAELLLRGLDETLVQSVPLDPADLRGLDTRRQVALVLDRLRQAGRLPEDFDERRAVALVEVFKANLRAARAWLPRPYPGRLTVLRAAESDRLGPTADGGWSALAATEVIPVPGDHRRMVTPPHVAELAAALRAAIGRQRQTPPFSPLPGMGGESWERGRG